MVLLGALRRRSILERINEAAKRFTAIVYLVALAAYDSDWQAKNHQFDNSSHILDAQLAKKACYRTICDYRQLLETRVAEFEHLSLLRRFRLFEQSDV